MTSDMLTAPAPAVDPGEGFPDRRTEKEKAMQALLGEVLADLNEGKRYLPEWRARRAEAFQDRYNKMLGLRAARTARKAA